MTQIKQSPTDMRVLPMDAEPVHRSPLLQSRVGRAQQRYDGAARLLACVVVTREAPGEDERVLLISSAKHLDEWILPKGGWETDESILDCAAREANEEAGVAGEVVAELGELEFASRRGAPCRFYGFKLRATHVYADWSENSRLRQWVSFADAAQLLHHRPELLEMLERASRC